MTFKSFPDLELDLDLRSELLTRGVTELEKVLPWFKT